MGFADLARDDATTVACHAHSAPDHRRWTDVLKHLWPTLGESV
jgi:hypothetical protein